MTYFKVIKDDKIVSAGCVFLKWNASKKRLYICNEDEGQFVQSYDEANIYRDTWLKPAQEDVVSYEPAIVSTVSQTEYEDIVAVLGEGEQIEVEHTPEVVYPVHEQNKEQEEKPMTISEMRALILEQQKQIKELAEKLNS